MSLYIKICFLICLSTFLSANEIQKSMDVVTKTNDKLATFQKKIDKEEEKRQILLNEYKYVNASLNSTKKYNQQLSHIILSQKNELKSYEQQLLDIEQTQKNIIPLMMKMIKSLKVLVQSDIPFLIEERNERITRLENMMLKADIETHEKYRIILEAFKVEYDYSKNIEAYQDEYKNRTYNFLRIGRVALYSQSLDLKEYAYYNPHTKQWQKIEDRRSKSNIRKGLKIAKKQQNVELLNLPFSSKKDLN